jgi:nicotinate-nucleotide adenylyltransferase
VNGLKLAPRPSSRDKTIRKGNQHLNIGVFGGTFDPPHNGHLIVAEYVRYHLSLEKVLFVPSWISPHKKDRTTAGAEHRLAMLTVAIEGITGFDVSEIEIARGGVSYTVDTLSDFHKMLPECHLSLLVGADNYAEFDTWKEPERVRSLAQLVVMTRPESASEVLPTSPEVCWIEVPEIRISSSDIRNRAMGGKSIRYLVPDRVAEYIESHHLYRQ